MMGMNKQIIYDSVECQITDIKQAHRPVIAVILQVNARRLNSKGKPAGDTSENG